MSKITSYALPEPHKRVVLRGGHHEPVRTFDRLETFVLVADSFGFLKIFFKGATMEDNTQTSRTPKSAIPSDSLAPERFRIGEIPEGSVWERRSVQRRRPCVRHTGQMSSSAGSPD
ncbi:hypothetical protein JAO29_09995 [Edaphobacter sp. HDX4]|uniref:hypothetical protein n=1 Tax=Edaphobacter sp. HDX4 TaxID=2794064 RepID=UPI002FE602D8